MLAGRQQALLLLYDQQAFLYGRLQVSSTQSSAGNRGQAEAEQDLSATLDPSQLIRVFKQS